MKYHKQEHLYIPGQDKVRGSCFPTVLACLLDLELNEVPYFHLMYWSPEERTNIYNWYQLKKERFFDRGGVSIDTSEDWEVSMSLWVRVKDTWLAAQGYEETNIPKEDFEQWLIDNVDQLYMLTGLSKRGVGHVVICKNGEMIHDPHPANDGVSIDHNWPPYSYLKKINE